MKIKNKLKISLALTVIAILLTLIPIKQTKANNTEKKVTSDIKVSITQKRGNTVDFDLLITDNENESVTVNCNSKTFYYNPINGLPDNEVFKPFYIELKNANPEEKLAITYICATNNINN